ncbi:hypothetical protein GCM10029964_061040 [Kibdelosporangium lantanae]
MTTREPTPPPGYRLVQEQELAFLWTQAAGSALLSLGVVRTLELSDIDRIKFVATLARIYQNHSDALPDIALMILDGLVQAASDLSDVTGH